MNDLDFEPTWNCSDSKLLEDLVSRLEIILTKWKNGRWTEDKYELLTLVKHVRKEMIMRQLTEKKEAPR
jgi:hypothetical protein